MSRPKSSGAPTWITTFADLMTLLLCFFVLLLSFSEMDVQKYRQIASSMASAFGGDKKRPQSAPDESASIDPNITPGKMSGLPGLLVSGTHLEGTRPASDIQAALRQRMQARADTIRMELSDEVKLKQVEVIPRDNEVIIRIHEKNSFPSGSADLQGSFGPVMDKIAQIVRQSGDKVVITGYTDNVPITGPRFRSNWDLSAARAVTVLHELLRRGNIDSGRVEVKGMADNLPIAPNDTADNRALNRRVEIAIVPPIDDGPGTARVIDGNTAEGLNTLP